MILILQVWHIDTLKIDAFWMVLRFRCILDGFAFYIYMNLNICPLGSTVIRFKTIFLIAIKAMFLMWFLGIFFYTMPLKKKQILFNVCRRSKHARTFANNFATLYFSLHWSIKCSCERLMYVTQAHVAQFKYANFKSMTSFLCNRGHGQIEMKLSIHYFFKTFFNENTQLRISEMKIFLFWFFSFS